MSILSTSTLAFALVYVCIGGHALLLWGGRREEKVVGSFGLVCLGMGVFTLGSALLTEARTLAVATFAQDLELAAASFAVAAYIVFSDQLRGRHDRRVRGFGYPLPVVTCLLWAFDMLHDDGVLATRGQVAVLHGPDLLQATLTPLGMLIEAWLCVGVALAAYLAYSGEDRQRLRPSAIAPILMISAVAFDLWSEHHGLNIVYLTEYSFLALAIAGSQRLIARGRRVAMELQQRTQELERGAARLAEAEEETVRREQLAAVGKLSAIVAHELRNPLAIIGNALGPLDKGTIPASTWDELLAVIDEETDRLDRLVGDVVTYSRPVAMRPASIPAGDLLETTARRWRQSEHAEAQVRVQVECPSAGLRCYADAELLTQALHNVIDNARRAMPRGGTVRAEAHEDDLDGKPATLFKVSDDGPGMPEEVLSRARELFFTTREDGTGLGLAIVERVVRAHRGKLEIESAPGAGTTIRLRIPLVPGEREAVGRAGRP